MARELRRLVDTSVRDCWQIDAARVRLGGRAWPGTFSGILGATADGLGCPVERLDAQLYKLLVYPSGGFFSSHRDTPKADGMIATLTISLPTAGAGGELIVRHRGREATLDMSHVTERRGSPFTLVCTKNRASYRRRLTEYEKDVSWMRSLIRSAPAGEWVDVCATELERLRETVANPG